MTHSKDFMRLILKLNIALSSTCADEFLHVQISLPEYPEYSEKNKIASYFEIYVLFFLIIAHNLKLFNISKSFIS